VSDDGVVGTVSIGSKDGEAVAEAQRRIELILDPPTAELGATYTGKVVNITKFGAFVNVLPGRDGLLHISKIGGGKRIDRVEDVLNLGDEVEVRVDDIDNSGKLSLSLASDEPPAPGEGGGAPRERSRDRDDRPRDRDDRPRRSRSDRDGGNGSDRGRGSSDAGASSDSDRSDSERPGSDREVASFEDQWENQAKAEFGDLGPEEATRSGGGGGGGGGGGRRGGGGGGRRRR
jgi:polyribonucleotide nucleotidyltransferase